MIYRNDYLLLRVKKNKFIIIRKDTHHAITRTISL